MVRKLPKIRFIVSCICSRGGAMVTWRRIWIHYKLPYKIAYRRELTSSYSIQQLAMVIYLIK